MCPYFMLNFFGKYEIILPAYSTFAFIGMLFMMIFLYVRMLKMDIPFKTFLLMIGVMAIGVIIGSKLIFVLTRIPDIISHLSIGYAVNTIITSGFVFYGGLFGALVGLYLFGKKYSLPFSKLTTVVIPVFPLFHFWGRIGCLFAGCCYGKTCSWGIILQGEPDVPRIPVQLFEAVCLLLIFGILIRLGRYQLPHFFMLQMYLLLYAICRFLLEFLRGDTIRGIWLGLSTSQWISLLILFVLCVQIGNGKFVLKKLARC